MQHTALIIKSCYGTVTNSSTGKNRGFKMFSKNECGTSENCHFKVSEGRIAPIVPGPLVDII